MFAKAFLVTAAFTLSATALQAEALPNSGKPKLPTTLPTPPQIIWDIILTPEVIGPQDHIPDFPATFRDPGPVPIPFPGENGWPIIEGEPSEREAKDQTPNTGAIFHTPQYDVSSFARGRGGGGRTFTSIQEMHLNLIKENLR